MKILSSHFAATCDKYDSPAPNGSFARRCEAARSSEKNSITAKIFKYALTAALFLLATAFLIGAAAGYWIIVSRSDVPTSGICSYDSTNLLRYYLADESSDQFGKALDGDLGSASATYDGKPHFPIVSKTPIKKFDGYDKALLPLQFADFNSGGDLTQAYFDDFGYEYVLLSGFNAGAKISPENIKTSAEILKNQNNYAWITGVPTNAGVYAVRITSLKEVTVVGSSATRSKYGSYIVIYTIAPATATITEAAPLSGSFITENTSSAQSAETMAADNIEGGDGTFIYGVDESGNPLNQGVKVTSLTLGGSSHSVSGYSDSSVGSVKSGLDIVLSDNVKASANHSEADNENFWYTVTASLSGAEAGNYALSNATSLRFRIAPVELNAADIKWYYNGAEVTDGKTVVYDGSEHGLTAKIDETTVSNRYYAKYGNDESVKSAVKSLIDAINGGSAPLTLGVYARSNDNYTAAIPSTSKVAKNAGIYLFSADVYLGGERSTDVYLTAEATKTLTINAKQITVNYSSDLVYNGKEQKPTFDLVGVIGSESMGVTAKVTQDSKEVTPINVGDYTLTLSVSGETYLNYVFGEPTLTRGTSTSHNYKITPKPVDITVTNVSNITYDGEVHAPTATYTDVNGATVNAVTKITKDGSIINATDVKNAGAYTLTASLKDDTNYVWADTTTTADKTYNWTINKAKATLTTSNVSNITYDGVVHAPTATYIDVNGTEVDAVTEITKDGTVINANDVKNAGAYTLTASLKDDTNYVWADTNKTDDKTYNWTISKLKITVKVTNSEQSATYSGKEPTINTDTTVTLTDSGDSSAPSFVSKELSFSVTKETGANVGTYALTPTVEAKSGYSVDNYDITCPTGTFTIKTAALTVTANSENITYGDDKPTFSVSYDGFVNNETESVLGGSPAFACDYVRYGNVGTYSITPDGLTSDNYEIAFVNGMLTVNKKPITATISLSSYSIYVTDCVLSVANPSVTFSGLVNGDSLTVTYTATGSETTVPTTLDDSTTLGKGVYTVNAVFSGDKAANYEITVTPATLTVKENGGNVTKVAVPVANTGLVYNANKQNGITHNQANYENYYTVSGDASATNAGKYTVTFSLKDTTNYVWADSTPDNKTYNWTISKATATLTTSNVSNITYDGEVHAPTATYIDVNGDTVNAVTKITKDGSKINDANDVKNAGAYTLTASLVDNTNYVWSDNTTDDKIYEWTISKATATLTTSNVSNITYDGEVHAPTATYIDVNGDTVNAVTKITKDGSKINDANDVKNAGAYTLTASLKDDTNYVWADSTPDDRTYNWTISKANITITLTVTSDTFTYGTEIQESTISYNIEGTNYNNELTISLVLINSGSGNSCELPSVLNAGKYNVSVTVSGDNISNYNVNKGEVNFTVAPLKVKFSGIININYTDEDKTLNAALLKNGLVKSSDDSDIKNLSMPSFASAVARTYDNSVDDSNAYTETKNPQGNITSISGEHGYYKVELDSAFTVGSTYKVTAKLKPGGNYTFEKDYDTIIVKYKTAKIGTAYYTIEDALSASGDITLAGDSSGPATYVITSFTQLSGYSKNYTLSGRKLIVPYADGVTDSATESNTSATESLYSALIIPNGITLNISSTLNITADIRHINNNDVCRVTAHGVVMNNGTINVNNGAKILAYGYLKGSGTVNLESGATATDLFRIFDYKGGTATKAMYKQYFPVNSYSLHNISCRTIINSGATYNAFFKISGTLGFTVWANGTVDIIAPTNAKNALFKLSSGYIEKSAKPAASWTSGTNYTALDTIAGSNQICGQIDIIDIHGVAVDGQVKISASALGVSVTMQTGKDLPLPITYMDISVCNRAKLTLSNCSYKFMPGAKLTVEEGATLETASGVQLVMYSTGQCNSAENFSGNPKPFYPGFCVDKTDALLIVNGTATINGSVSGKILSESKDAVLKITTNNTEITVLKSYSSGSIETETTSANAIGNTVDGDNQNLENTTYKSQEVGGKIVWVIAGNIKTITFDSCGGTHISSKTIILTNGSFTVPSEYLETPWLDYYTFDGWFTAKDGGDKIDVGSTVTVSSGSGITLYAHWTPNTYQIVYEWTHSENSEYDFSSADIVCPSDEYEAGETLTLTAPTTTATGLSFVAWYDKDGNQISNITLSNIANLLGDDGKLHILGNWTNKSVVTYTVSIIVGNKDLYNSDFTVDCETEITATEGEYKDFTPTVIDSKGNPLDLSYGTAVTNYNYAKYFVGWYTDESFTSPYTNKINGDTTLYAKWEDKIKTTIEFKDTNNTELLSSKTKFFMPGFNINKELLDSIHNELRVLESINAGIEHKEYYFDKWFVGNEELKSQAISLTENVVIKAQYKRCYHIIISGDDGISQKNTTIYVDPSETTYLLTINGSSDSNSGSRYRIKEYSITINGSTQTTTINNETTTIDININLPADSSKDITISAITQIQYQITIDNGGYTPMTVKIGNQSGEDVISGEYYDKGVTIYVKSNGRYGITANGDELVGEKEGSNTIQLTQKLKLQATTSCIAAGTLITLWDGRKKKVEDLTNADVLLVFNHETGAYDYAKLLINEHQGQSYDYYSVMNLYFSDGSVLKIIKEHGFFDLDLNRYVYINENNYSNYIGHKFFQTDWNGSEFVGREVTLDNVAIKTEYTAIFSPVTEKHFNIFTENILSVSTELDGLLNIFEYGENMQYDEEKMKADIEKYGLFTYDDWKDYVSKDIYDLIPFKYYKVAIGKGYITMEHMHELIEKYFYKFYAAQNDNNNNDEQISCQNSG